MESRKGTWGLRNSCPSARQHCIQECRQPRGSTDSCFESLVKDAMTFSSVRRLHREGQSVKWTSCGLATGICAPLVDEGALGPSGCLARSGLAPGEIDEAQSARSDNTGTMYGVVSRLDCLPQETCLSAALRRRCHPRTFYVPPERPNGNVTIAHCSRSRRLDALPLRAR